MNILAKISIIRASLENLALARQAILEVHERTAFDIAGLEAFLLDRSCFLLLAIEGERVVGSLNGYALRHPHMRRPQFLLYEIDVLSEHRRKGIGSALVRSFSEEARKADAFEIWVLTNSSNHAAMSIYLRNGYSRRNPDDVMLSLLLE
jgi:ribosomal protein S18 acetylase RimI-like enzyme